MAGGEEGQILVVDDDEDIRDFISLALSGEGYRVRTAPDGAAALEEVRRTRPKLILLDMQMPVMSGWEFAQAYRQEPGAHAPIVVLTAATNAPRYSQQIQAQGYLGKPFGLDDLLQLVDRYARPN